MGGKSQPNLQDIASVQGQENRNVVRDQTYANRPTQITPFGYQSWNPESFRDPATGEMTTRWTQTSGLTPELQDILNKQIAIQGGRTDIAGMLTGRMGGEFGSPMDWSNLSPLAATPQTQFTVPEPSAGDPYETRQRAEDAVYGQAMSRLEPQFEARRNAMDIRLRSQGLHPEDATYKAQMDQLNQQQTDATNQAIWSSVGEGRDEAAQMFGQQMGRQAQDFGQSLSANQANFGQAMQAGNYANQLRQQMMAEQMQQRGFSLNEINALLSGQQVGLPQMPSFMGANAATPAPIYQGAADQASIQAAQNPWSSIAGIAGSALGGYLGNPAAFGD